MGALNLPSAADLERLTRRVRSLSQRLEGIEDGVDRLDERLAAIAGLRHRRAPRRDRGGAGEARQRGRGAAQEAARHAATRAAAKAGAARRPRRPRVNASGPVGSRAGASEERGRGRSRGGDERGHRWLRRGEQEERAPGGSAAAVGRRILAKVSGRPFGLPVSRVRLAPRAAVTAVSASAARRRARGLAGGGERLVVAARAAASRAIVTIAAKAMPWRAATAARAPVSRSAASAPAALHASRQGRRVGA